MYCSKKNAFVLIVLMFIIYGVLNKFDSNFKPEYKVSIESDINQKCDFQLFYKTPTNKWSEEYSDRFSFASRKSTKQEAILPRDTMSLRLDFENTSSVSKVTSLELISGFYSKKIDLLKMNVTKNDIKTIQKVGDGFQIVSNGSDPFVVFRVDGIMTELYKSQYWIIVLKNIILSLLLGVVFIKATSYAKDSSSYFNGIMKSSKNILFLAFNDYKSRYASSYLGIIWGYVQPLITILTYWFVFQVGFRSSNVGDVPFIVWFVCGIIPWFFFADAVVGATNSFMDYSYLVKKIFFKIEILPFVRIVSAFFIHALFLLIMIISQLLYGVDISWHIVQIIYYEFCLLALVCVVGIFTSAITPFFKDLNQIVMIILNVGFWFTPIGWSYLMIPEKFQFLFKLNPMFYIVEGFRDSIVYKRWFFERPYHTLYFWVVLSLLFMFNVKIFGKLKQHFSDVL